jgi:hypothetical protein
MTPERWQEIEGVFQAAVEMPPEDRIAFLDKLYGPDDEISSPGREASRIGRLGRGFHRSSHLD